MDQQPGSQQPPQAPTPPPAPIGAQPQPASPNPYGQPPKKSTGLIIGIIAGAVLLVAGIVTVLIITLSGDKEDTDKKDDTKTSQNDDTKKDSNEDDEKKRLANAKTAKSTSDFNVVCETGSVSNAAAAEKPYKIVAFSKADGARSWSTLSLDYSADYYTKYDAFAEVGAVACLSEKAGSAVKTKTCDFKTSGENTSLDYYATAYEVTLYEAKSGKKIKDLGTVSAPATTCPSFVSYDKSDPKVIAKPDADAVDALLAAFVKE